MCINYKTHEHDFLAAVPRPVPRPRPRPWLLENCDVDILLDSTHLVILREERVFLTTLRQEENYVRQDDSNNFYKYACCIHIILTTHIVHIDSRWPNG